MVDILVYVISGLAIAMAIWSIILIRRTNQIRKNQKREKLPVSREVTIGDSVYIITAVMPDSEEMLPLTDLFDD